MTFPPGSPSPPAAPGKPDPGHFKIGGKSVSWDALFIAGGGILGVLFLAHRGSGGGATAASTAGLQGGTPTYPSGPGLGSATPVDISALSAPPNSTGAPLGPADYVSALYGDVLGRSAAGDPSGAGYWTQAVASQGAAAATAQFLATPEAQVQAAYQSDLGRNADPGGLQWAVGELQSGTTRAQLDAQLRGSSEYRATHAA